MGLHEFNVLPADVRIDCLGKNGIYLATRETQGYLVNLYAVSTFYVEAWYESEKNSIKNVLTFRSTNCLEPYLENIPLPN